MLACCRAALAAAAILLGPSLLHAQTAPATPSAPAATDAAKSPASPEAKEAQDAARGAGRLAACRPDIAKLCPDAKGGDRRSCLRDNAAKLSPECTSALADDEAKAKAMREACATDVRTHCADAGKAKGGDGIVQCLRTNKAKLTPACTTAFDARFPPG